MSQSENPGRALITGASSGIGRSYARILAARGYHLIITARRSHRLKELSEELTSAFDISIEQIPLDLASPEGLETLNRRITEGPDIDFLVHSAGFGTRGHLAEIDEPVIESMVKLHCLAAASLVRSALPGMIKRNRGRIILVSSLGAFMTTAEYTLYSATKSFLNTLALGLRDELAATEVLVQSVCPGLVKTEFTETPAFRGFSFDAVPEKFWLKPETVVKESLHRLDHRYRPILVPTFGARLFLGTLNAPIIGSVIKAAISASSRRRIRAGKPAVF